MDQTIKVLWWIHDETKAYLKSFFQVKFCLNRPNSKPELALLNGAKFNCKSLFVFSQLALKYIIIIWIRNNRKSWPILGTFWELIILNAPNFF